jgi:acyl-CoA dehydrogenase
MAIDFTLSPEQKKVQLESRQFAENILAPIVRQADNEADPLRAFQLTKPAYIEAYRAGVAFCMLPRRYGGAGLTSVELILATEELCAVDPGFACTILVNGLGLMPVVWYGSDEQKERFLTTATSDTRFEYLVGYAVSEPAGTPGGTANFDAPLAYPVGLNVVARRDGDFFVLTGRKYWPCNAAGWDGRGADASIVLARTDPSKGGTEGLSAIMIERGTPGVTYRPIDKMGHRLTHNTEIVFSDARVPAHNLIEGSVGNGDLLINRNFAWSGPVAGIAAVGVARAAYEDALRMCRTYTSGGPRPIIHYQNVGYMLGDIAARIEAARYFCWKAAHYLDQHDQHGELIGAMCKTFCSELMFDTVYKCMQVVGVNATDKRYLFEKYLREAAIFPLYDAGNMGMQRRRIHGVLASPDFNPRALMDDDAIEFRRSMETIDTVQMQEPASFSKPVADRV